MEKQVLSIEQMQELIDMGIDVSNATMLWFPKMAIDGHTGKGYVESHYLTINHINSEHFWNTREGRETIPTFTLQDVLILLEPCHRLMVIKQELDEWLDSAFNLLKFQYKK